MEHLMTGQGEDGGIANFMDDIAAVAAHSNGIVVEIGVGKGKGSTLAIFEGLSRSQQTPMHISVDIQDYMEWKPPVAWWRLLLMNSTHESTERYVHNLLLGRAPGLIFIDTHHTRDHIEAELAVWSRLAGPETTWLFHDTYMMGERNEMVDGIEAFASTHCAWVYDDFRTEPHGLGRMRWR